MPSPAESHANVRAQIKAHCRAHARDFDAVTLVAVGKLHAPEKIRALYACGQRHFAENYVQEAEAKIAALADLSGIVWHFIGAIQSRKCRKIAQLFDWVHTLDGVKRAKLLNQHRAGRAPLNALIQVNLQDEAGKAGAKPDDVAEIARMVHNCDNLRFKGLMLLPRAQTDFASQRAVFGECRALLQTLQRQHPNATELSMGMSDDMRAAIAEGATQIRIGTALFGARPARKNPI